MLFINNDEAKILKLRFVFNKDMRTNDDMDFTRRQTPEESFFSEALIPRRMTPMEYFSGASIRRAFQ
jgi:hypothetical protein